MKVQCLFGCLVCFVSLGGQRGAVRCLPETAKDEFHPELICSIRLKITCS